MQLLERLVLPIKIILPFLILALINASPASYEVIASLHSPGPGINESPDAAATRLRQVVSREPWRVWIWEQIGTREYQAGNPEAAVDALLRARDDAGLSLEGEYLLGEVYYQQNELALAQQTWEALSRDPLLLSDDLAVRTYDRLARLQRQNEDLPGAVETLRAWHRFAPSDSRATYLLGLHLCITDPEQGLALLLDASSIDSTYTSTAQKIRRGLGMGNEVDDPAYRWLMIGRALANAGQWDLAAASFQNAVDANPGYAEAWAFLGEAYIQVGNDGIPYLDRARELDPRSVIVHAIMAMQYRRSGDYEKAIAYLQAVANQEPDEPLWQVELGYTWVDQGDLPTALLYFQKAVELAPESSQYWQYLAHFSVEYDVDIHTIGLQAARRAVVLSPDDPGALDVMGWTMVSLGDYATAERFLQQAVDKDSTYTLAVLHLGQLYLQKQDMERAYPYLKKVSLVEGDDSLRVIAVRLLQRYYNEGG